MAEKQTHSSKVDKYLGKMHTRAHHFRGRGEGGSLFLVFFSLRAFFKILNKPG